MSSLDTPESKINNLLDRIRNPNNTSIHTTPTTIMNSNGSRMNRPNLQREYTVL